MHYLRACNWVPAHVTRLPHVWVWFLWPAVCPLTAGTEFMFICWGWFMGEAARGPIVAWDIWVLGRVMWLNWLIPVQRSKSDTLEIGTTNRNKEICPKAKLVERNVFLIKFNCNFPILLLASLVCSSLFPVPYILCSVNKHVWLSCLFYQLFYFTFCALWNSHMYY